MAPQASSVPAVPQETGLEQRRTGPHLVLAEPPAAAQQGIRPLEAAECAMCRVALPLALLVPDGGQACADIRWYCKDVRSCTGRWTAAVASRRACAPADPGDAVAEAGQSPSHAVAAEPPGGLLQAAEPV